MRFIRVSTGDRDLGFTFFFVSDAGAGASRRTIQVAPLAMCSEDYEIHLVALYY